jgi:hypothetical protein
MVRALPSLKLISGWGIRCEWPEVETKGLYKQWYKIPTLDMGASPVIICPSTTFECGSGICTQNIAVQAIAAGDAIPAQVSVI